MRKLRKYLLLTLALLSVFLMFCGFDRQQQKVYDKSQIFLESEKLELTNYILQMDDAYGLDLVVLTTNDTQGQTPLVYADTFYNNGNFGYDDNRTGALLLIDFGSHNVHISTCGNAIKQINDVEIEVILDDIFVYLEEEDYLNACYAFVDSTCEAYTSSAYDNATLDNYKQVGATQEDWLSPVFGPAHLSSGAHVLRNPLVSLGIAALVALVVVLIIAHKRKPRMTAGARTYENKGSFKVLRESDIFTGRHTVTRHIDSGSHGGSSHSTGGISHGGGGRSF